MAFEPAIDSDNDSISEGVEKALRVVEDPELHIDVWTLELIRHIKISEGKVDVTMTLTTPFCPYGPSLIEEINNSVLSVGGVKEAEIHLTFEEPWKPSDDLKAYLGMPSFDE
jgi:metal-sulfur cluster biosynthetic enzyme